MGKIRSLVQTVNIDNDYAIRSELISEFYQSLGYDVDIETIVNGNNKPPSFKFSIYKVKE